jgi:starch-binding outer membrane protein, SusD/RagB family
MTRKIFGIFRYIAGSGLMFVLSGLNWSCNKAVEVNPPTTSLTSASVYASDASAIAAVTGIFQQMSAGYDFFGQASSGDVDFTTVAGLSADEFSLYPNSPTILSQAYPNALQNNNVPFWSALYNCIYLANSAISGLQGSSAITTSLKEQLLGEVLFVRAFCHFYLTNIFGDVPLVTTPNYTTNEQIARSPSALVYQQVIADLTQAQSLLSQNFVLPGGGTTSERTLPNQGAATALLARAYLYTKKYDSAALEATLVINNNQYSLVSGLDSVFLMNSTEAIWQMETVSQGYNTPDGYTYILTSGPNNYQNPVYLSPYILTAFEAGDRRAVEWVGVDSSTGTDYYFPYKYKVQGGPTNTPVSEYYMMLRLAEQYLIRAESEAQQSDLSDASADLDIIRNRAGLPDVAGTSSQSALLTAIMHERQVELFCEWGHRWLDLVRTGNASTVLGAPGNICSAKGGSWETTAELFPIPLSEIEADVNLTQNPGYQ